ncbi:MAG TPA: pantoate--beta-alanine ligase [Thermoanaerobaculia bacterium]|nr:pantoate--beta-alanine ligase [Thermoanaerobaculia bacterium]
MEIARSVDEVRSLVRRAREEGRTIGFVPTMGYLHEGHLSLIDVAGREGADFTVVSIFVNPAQFGPNEDFEEYPRDEKRDRELLEERGADLLFLPPVETMYPEGATTRVRPGSVALPLEGERRPGHFEGVATVVLKLLNIVMPDVAVFGEKDAQQCAAVRRMIRDLDVPVRLAFGATMREADGLAMSSRNAYLSAKERALAPALFRALLEGKRRLESGAGSAEEIDTAMRESLASDPEIVLDYLTVVDPETFLPPEDLDRDLLLAGAVRIGTTRLIDNVKVHPRPRS